MQYAERLVATEKEITFKCAENVGCGAREMNNSSVSALKWSKTKQKMRKCEREKRSNIGMMKFVHNVKKEENEEMVMRREKFTANFKIEIIKWKNSARMKWRSIKCSVRWNSISV